MGELALLRRFRCEFELADLDRGGAGSDGLNVEAVGSEGDHLVVVEIDHLPRMGDQGRSVAGQQILALATPTMSGEPRRAPTSTPG